MGLFRSLWTLLKLVVGLALTVGATALGGLVGERLAGGGAANVTAIVAGLLALWLFVLRPLRRGRKVAGATDTPASIVGIERVPPPGAPWYYWTYVTFDCRGERVKLHLSKQQARSMFSKIGVGDVGHLKHAGERLIDWQPASARRPVPAGAAGPALPAAGAGPSLFLSYAHEWQEDARYLAEFFRSRGFAVWHDERSLRFGDRLTETLAAGIRQADYFLPLLSTEYCTSEWCVEELEIAAESGCRVIPLKVSEGELILPPRLQRLYRDQLGEPAYLDLRGRNPVPRLEQLARQMAG